MSAIHSMPRRFPLSSHLADMYWLCRREQQTPQRCATRRRLSMCNPSPIRRPTNPPPQRRPSPPSREAAWRLERLGAGRCAVGNQPPAPNPTDHWRPPGTGPLIPSYDLHLPCHAHFVSCAATMRNALWLVARPSLSGIYYLVIRSPRTSLQAASLRSRGDIMLSYQVSASLLTVAPGRQQPQIKGSQTHRHHTKCGYQNSPCGPAEVPNRLYSADEARIAPCLYPPHSEPNPVDRHVSP